MSEEKYSSLVDDFCKLLPDTDAKQLKETGSMSVEGIEVTFVYMHDLIPGVLYVTCDLGLLANADEKTCYQKMLEINFFLIHQLGPQMAIHPETGEPLLITRIPLDGFDAKSLLQVLQITIRMIKDWRSGSVSSFNVLADEIKKIDQ